MLRQIQTKYKQKTNIVCLDGLAGGKPLLSKKEMKAQLRFTEQHLNKLQDCWNIILKNRSQDMQSLALAGTPHTVKHGGGGLMTWDCFEGSKPGSVAVTELTKSSVDQSALDTNLRPSISVLHVPTQLIQMNGSTSTLSMTL